MLSGFPPQFTPVETGAGMTTIDEVIKR